MTAVRIAAAAAHFGRDLPRALERLEVVIGAGHYAGAALLVLPAATLGGFPDGGARGVLPLDLDGPELRRVQQLAASMIVCLGYTELVDGSLANSAVCVNGDGVLGHYRQVHERPPYQPSGGTLGPAGANPMAVGDRIEAFDTPLGRLGLLIDVDKAFPEAARTLALDGAQLIACPSAWPASVTQRATRLPQDRQSRLFDLYDCTRAA